MDRFYRHMRQKTGLLMDGEKPVGGKYSFDADNRQPWKGAPVPPTPPTFSPDEVTREVCDLVSSRFARHPGEISPDAIPATNDDARSLWDWAKQACMAHFGPFEDAMTTASSGLFHTRISPLLNLHRLLPRTIVDDVVSLDIPLASKEGFIRQVLGWREFVRHVHRETSGFRTMPSGSRPSRAKTPGDGGYGAWSKVEWTTEPGGPDGGAKPNALGVKRAVPPAFWGETSGLSCLDRVVADVWAEAYSHHITRLMILCNLAALLDLEPRQVADWFWVAYADAYDWVVEPNVLGMGLFATGELMTTKPYVSGTPYIHKMSDYCRSCRFHPKKNCPISSLYWAYLARHEDKLADVARLRVPLASLRKRGEDKRLRDRATFEWVSRALDRGRPLSPEEVP
jgi:deoxyribodipyrimidine photolyase-related protein